MSSRNFPVFPLLSDSVFSDRFSRIDRLFSQLTGDTPVARFCRIKTSSGNMLFFYDVA